MSKDLLVDLKIPSQSSKPVNENIFSFKDVELNNYVREISTYQNLTYEQEKELAKRIEAGDKVAKQEMIQANLKLVITVAKKVIHMSSLPLVDLIQEGNVGLIIAIEKYNYRLGYRFSTYASWWIKQAMFKAISEQSHCMKIPVYIQETLSKFSKVKYQMEQDSNSSVKNEDVAKKMKIEPNKIETFLSAYSKTISIENSLENKDGKEMNFCEILADDKASVSENIELEALKSDIDNVISTLKDREQEVVKMRFGLDNSARYTLEEIGNIYGVTKECIRQTELRALKKMKMSGQELLSCYIY